MITPLFHFKSPFCILKPPMGSWLKYPLAALLLLAGFPGCIQQIALSSLGGIMETGFTVINEEQDLQIADKSIASDLKLLETIIRKDPDNRQYLLLASEGYTSYAQGFVEDQSPDRARILYERGKEYGMRILRQHRAFAAAEDSGVAVFRAALAELPADEAPAVFWTAAAWGSAITLSLTDPGSIAELPRVEAMMNWVLDKDSLYFYGGAHFFLGTLYGGRPKLFGGDPDISRKHFENCLRINGGKFLLTYVYEARSLAVQTQDRALFEDLLHKVDTASLDILPEARLSNAVAKRKAQALMARIDELF